MSTLTVPPGAEAIQLFGKKAVGRFALVDEADYDLVSQYRWTVTQFQAPGRILHGPYAATRVTSVRGTPTTLSMHKMLTGYKLTDHANHNTLDNRRSNLRPATATQNGANKRKRLAPSTSRYKGVCWNTQAGKWTAVIAIHGRRFQIGRYASEAVAARAYDGVAYGVWGEYAYTNFPLVGQGVTADQLRALHLVADEDAAPLAAETPAQRFERILRPALTLGRIAELAA